jgi:hypothetical protein
MSMKYSVIASALVAALFTGTVTTRADGDEEQRVMPPGVPEHHIFLPHMPLSVVLYFSCFVLNQPDREPLVRADFLTRPPFPLSLGSRQIRIRVDDLTFRFHGWAQQALDSLDLAWRQAIGTRAARRAWDHVWPPVACNRVGDETSPSSTPAWAPQRASTDL